MRGARLTAARRRGEPGGEERGATPGWRRRRGTRGPGLGPGGARHDDVLLAAHGAQEALELELERLRFRGLEPYVVNDLLERSRTEVLPARLQPEEVPATLSQV